MGIATGAANAFNANAADRRKVEDQKELYYTKLATEMQADLAKNETVNKETAARLKTQLSSLQQAYGLPDFDTAVTIAQRNFKPDGTIDIDGFQKEAAKYKTGMLEIRNTGQANPYFNAPQAPVEPNEAARNIIPAQYRKKVLGDDGTNLANQYARAFRRPELPQTQNRYEVNVKQPDTLFSKIIDDAAKYDSPEAAYSAYTALHQSQGSQPQFKTFEDFAKALPRTGLINDKAYESTAKAIQDGTLTGDPEQYYRSIGGKRDGIRWTDLRQKPDKEKFSFNALPDGSGIARGNTTTGNVDFIPNQRPGDANVITRAAEVRINAAKGFTDQFNNLVTQVQQNPNSVGLAGSAINTWGGAAQALAGLVAGTQGSDAVTQVIKNATGTSPEDAAAVNRIATELGQKVVSILSAEANDPNARFGRDDMQRAEALVGITRTGSPEQAVRALSELRGMVDSKIAQDIDTVKRANLRQYAPPQFSSEPNQYKQQVISRGRQLMSWGLSKAAAQAYVAREIAEQGIE